MHPCTEESSRPSTLYKGDKHLRNRDKLENIFRFIFETSNSRPKEKADHRHKRTQRPQKGRERKEMEHSSALIFANPGWDSDEWRLEWVSIPKKTRFGGGFEGGWGG